MFNCALCNVLRSNEGPRAIVVVLAKYRCVPSSKCAMFALSSSPGLGVLIYDGFDVSVFGCNVRVKAR